ncbi:MAG: ABC transporter ATP-binding protein [Myxococcota bacterium]
MITVDRVWKSYGPRVVLRGVSLAIAPGERIALVGPNGSGKTTLLRCVLGMVQFTGAIRVCGHDPLLDHASAQIHAAYVPQRAPALPVPVGELVAFWSAERGQAPEGLVAACRALGLDLGGVWTQPFPSLSGGMQQKLLAAMALATDCPVLLLDEPTANLDPAARVALFDALGARSPAPTVVLSSHRLDELRRLVDRVVVLADGEIREDRPIEAFLADPALAAAAGLDVEPDPRPVPFARRS